MTYPLSTNLQLDLLQELLGREVAGVRCVLLHRQFDPYGVQEVTVTGDSNRGPLSESDGAGEGALDALKSERGVTPAVVCVRVCECGVGHSARCEWRRVIV
jgi:hypothetical protein